MDFDSFEDARSKAGIFFTEFCQETGISIRTIYRWKERNKVPRWAYQYMKMRCGDLEIHGAKGFFIERGVIYHRDLNRIYSNLDLWEWLRFRCMQQMGFKGITVINGGKVESLQNHPQQRRVR